MNRMERFSFPSTRLKLKKSVLAILLVIGFFAMSALAETRRVKDVGIKCGFSLSGLTSSLQLKDGDPSFLSGITGGLFFNLPLTATSLLQAEINYVVRGARYYSVAKRNETNAGFSYLEFPVLLNLSPNRTQGCIVFGPYYAFLVGSPEAYLQKDWTNPGDVRNWDAGLIASIHWQLTRMFVELRFTQGFVNIIHEPTALSSQKNHYRSSTISLLFGVFI